MACTSQLELCLADPATITCISCDEAKILRCIIMAKLREMVCECMSSPIRIGDVVFPSPVEAMRELRLLLQLTFVVCEQEAMEEGPVMETVWENRCNSSQCGTCCTDDYSSRQQRFHSYTGCDGDCS